ncbi:MAG: HlyD family secretion protein [Candidatus Rokuibacteriota bacterium]|nr:MAG: HlyD family secretion protein [Candidatus Rokubacteria bacterium]PYN53346.1 MAG: HlyD family secretion protein [Candidatus Rokubacteria bacterium]
MSDTDTGDAFRRVGTGRRRRRAIALALLAVVVVVIGAYGVRVWRYWDRHISTDDAFVEAHISPVSARVRGTVVEVLARDNEEVPAGAALVRLDPRDLEMKAHQARAALATAASNLRTAAAGVPMTDESTRSQVALAEATAAGAALGIDGVRRVIDERRSRLLARRAAVQAATADVAARQADFDRAGLDRGRMQELLGRELVSRQEFDHADSAFRMAGAALEAARRRLDGARAEVAQAEAELASQEVALAQAGRQREAAEAGLGDARSRRGEVTIRSAEAASAQAKMAEARATLQEAELNLEYATILAPVAGRVTRRTVEVGQVVQPGQPLLALVDAGQVWVIANYKETQLTHVRPGQRAAISVDTHPGLVLQGRVDSIQSGTGSRFSLLPPQNASGNFVKVVQRIPVKLVLEPGQNGHALLVPGMSVVPVIELR